jgi:hypothetical protein
MSVISLSSLDEFKARTLGSFVAVVKYELPGCAVCDRVRPMYAQFPSAFPAAVWCETSSSEIAKQQNVEAFPSFDLFRRGVKVMRITGGDELGSLQFAVTELLRAKVMPLTEEVFLLDWQPNREQLLILKGQTKAKTLINLRHPTEKGYVSAKEEAEIAGIENYAEVGIVDVQGTRKSFLNYLVCFTVFSDITPAYLSEACEAINKAEKPVVVHCLVGLTAVLVRKKKLFFVGTAIIRCI